MGPSVLHLCGILEDGFREDVRRLHLARVVVLTRRLAQVQRSWLEYLGCR